MNLQFLFDEQIRDVQELTPGYENHGHHKVSGYRSLYNST
ncbi:hypothetical protein S101359_00738 [Bacillus atrophaeus]|nr:hypothetical protein S101359_00738 [Bacillus atrophaeus]